jgi:hypothetical protein
MTAADGASRRAVALIARRRLRVAGCCIFNTTGKTPAVLQKHLSSHVRKNILLSETQ